MKNKMKRIIALICVLALTIGSVSFSGPIKEVTANTESKATTAKPVYVEGFNHVTTTNFGMSDPFTADMSTKNSYSLKDDNGQPISGNFDDTVFSAKVTWNAGSGGACPKLMLGAVGGTQSNSGFQVFPNKAGSAINIYDNYLHPLTTYQTSTTSDALLGVLWATDVASALAVDSFTFVDNEFILQVGFDYYEKESQTYLKLTFYVNGKQVKIEERLTSDRAKVDQLDMSVKNYAGDTIKHGNIIGYKPYANNTGTLKLVSVVPEKEVAKPVYMEGFNHVTTTNFGMPDPFTADMSTKNSYSLKDDNGQPISGNFDDTIFSAKVTWNAGTGNACPKLMLGAVGGTQSNSGFQIYPNKAGSAINICDNGAHPLTTYQTGTSDVCLGVLWATDVASALAVDSFTFVDNEFILQVGFDYYEKASQTYLKLTFYVNGKQVKIEERLTSDKAKVDQLDMSVKNYAGETVKHGNIIGYKPYASNTGTLILKAVVPVGQEPEPGPGTDAEMPNETFKKITFSHFNIENGTYADNGSSNFQAEGKAKISLDETVFCGQIKMDVDKNYYYIKYTGQGDNRLFIDIASGKWRVYFTEQGGKKSSLLANMDTKSAVAEDGWLDFMISTEIMDADNDGIENDIKYGFWFDKVLYDNQYLIIKDKAELIGSELGIQAKGQGLTFELRSIPELVEEEVEPEMPNESFKKITFSHFKIDDGIYSNDGSSNYQAEGKAKFGLDKTVFCGQIKLDLTEKYYIKYTGKGNNRLHIDIASGKWRVYYTEEGKGASGLLANMNTTSAVAADGWLDFMISTEIIDANGDNKENDIKYGFWFGGKLYNDEYLIIEDKAELIGNELGIQAREVVGLTFEVRSIPELVEPVNPEDIVVMNESFKKITFSHLAIEDGTYSHVVGETSLRAMGKMKKTMDKTIFSGDVFVKEGKRLDLRFGGNATQQGLMFEFTPSGTISLIWVAKGGNEYLVTGINNSKAKTTLTGDWLNLKISTEIIDADKDGQNNDIRIAIWFNDIAYLDEYIIVRDKANLLGSYFSIVCREAGSSVAIRSIPELIEPFDFTLYGLTEDWEKTLLDTGLEARIPVGGSKTSAAPTGDGLNLVIPIVGITVSAAALLLYIFMKRREKGEA